MLTNGPVICQLRLITQNGVAFNYRTVFGLSFISQLVERAVAKQLLEHIHVHNLCPCSTKGLSPDPVGDP